MTVYIGDSRARTMDFEEGDVGYVVQSTPHYIENTGDTDLVFLEMFKSARYEDISLGEWMAHTPHQFDRSAPARGQSNDPCDSQGRDGDRPRVSL